MTMYSPNLRIERLVVAGGGRVVYDEKFHAGLNILRGENSSGKSTVMDFIFYSLGGELSNWREAALRCDAVWVSVLLNGKPAVLVRDIDAQSSRPMRIFLGSMDEAWSSPAEGWQVYPYRRGDKDSFSQVLFRYLGLPEVQYGESDTKITMNQILRLLYADQLSPVEKIFRFQRFDDAITRQTVGDLLCGAFSPSYYNARLRKLDATKEFDSVFAQISTLIKTHSFEGHPLTPEWLDTETLNFQSDLDRTNGEIERIEGTIFKTQFEDRLTLNDQEETYARLQKLQAKIGELQSEIDRTSLERSDSERFIAAVGEKLEQLKQSDTVLEQLREIEFEVCPSCLSPVSHSDSEGACSLCKTPIDHDLVRSRSLKLIGDFSRQLDQSRLLQDVRSTELISLNDALARTKALWEQAERHYRVAVRSPTTELRSKLRELNRRAGYLTRQLEDLAGKKGIIQQLSDLSERREALSAELDEINRVLSSEERRNVTQVASARHQISRNTIAFLRRDLARQSTFSNATEVSFEFDADRISVNGDSYFSASSMVYLKNSFLSSFLFVAANDKTLNHPRILIMDTVEDKGMEPERSQNFQRLLAEYSSTALSEHQIIIATSMIAPELEDKRYTVGDFYTHDNRTMRI